jgi:hypothetical protein
MARMSCYEAGDDTNELPYDVVCTIEFRRSGTPSSARQEYGRVNSNRLQITQERWEKYGFYKRVSARSGVVFQGKRSCTCRAVAAHQLDELGAPAGGQYSHTIACMHVA